MAEARGRSLWAHTSALIAQQANINRDRKKRPRPYKPNDFNPYVARRKKGRKPVTVEELTRDVLDATGVEPRRKRRVKATAPPGSPPPPVR